MDVGPRKIGRKTSGLCGNKTKANPMTQEGTISKTEPLTPTEVGVGANIKTSLCTTCSMRRILTIEQGIVLFSSNPKRRRHKSQPNLRHQARRKRSITHPTGINLRNHRPQTNLYTKTTTIAQNTNPTTKDIPRNTTSHATTCRRQTKPIHHSSNQLSSATFVNNIPNYRPTNIPTKNGAKQSTSTSTPSQESSQQATSFQSFGTIHTITGGSNLTFENKRHKREHYHQVNHVVVDGPIVHT
jgi:hypothetical protein